MLHGMLLKRCRQRTGYRASCASRYCDAITIPSCLGSNNGGLNICCRDSPAARQGMIPWPPFVCTIFQTLNWLEIYSARRSTQRKKPFPFSVPRLFIYQRIHFKPFPITYISLHPGSPLPDWASSPAHSRAAPSGLSWGDRVYSTAAPFSSLFTFKQPIRTHLCSQSLDELCSPPPCLTCSLYSWIIVILFCCFLCKASI